MLNKATAAPSLPSVRLESLAGSRGALPVRPKMSLGRVSETCSVQKWEKGREKKNK